MGLSMYSVCRQGTVSYTHLIQDAEKIRILRKKYAEENTPESLAKLNRMEEAIAYFITLEPVSYTHLDVYKRQQLYF